MFSFDALVLKKIQVKDNKNLISLFSRDYGKITAWIKESKNKSPVDIGNIYNFSTKSQNGINNIDSYKPKRVISSEGLGYRDISNILTICATFEKILPNGMILESIYEDYSSILQDLQDNEKNQQTSALFRLRLLKKLGIAKTPDEETSSLNFRKIFNIADTYGIDSIMKLQGIRKENIEEIDSYNTQTLQYYIS